MVGMKALAYEQRLQLLDLVEQFTNNQPIDDALLADPLVVYRFLFLSKDQSDIVFDFVTAYPCPVVSIDVERCFN